MRLPFLDREGERRRLRRALRASEGAFCCLYGRRRCGKSRLMRETLPKGRSVYYVGDEREAGLQRAAVAEAIGELLPGFADVDYADWHALLRRWWREAPNGAVLALDEFPYLVRVSPELPSLLQKSLDANQARPVHLVLAGSSQRMMQGLVLDESEPLYGRAREIMKIEPLGVAWLPKAMGMKKWRDALEAYAVWGGVPRYWELACDYGSLWKAIETLTLDPLGVLHHEPERLLLDDMRDTIQSSSILALVGQGCHRLSEIAARLGKPSTSLTRPVQRLLGLGLLKRDVPFGQNPRSSKSTIYTVADPFLAFWFRFVDPNRSRLGAGALHAVKPAVKKRFPQHVGAIWEHLVRAAVPRSAVLGKEWNPAHRWWGAGLDRKRLEIDVVAESLDGRILLVGEAKLRVSRREVPGALAQLGAKAERLPFAEAYAEIRPILFTPECDTPASAEGNLATAEDVLPALT